MIYWSKADTDKIPPFIDYLSDIRGNPMIVYWDGSKWLSRASKEPVEVFFISEYNKPEE
jgi:hypothetical protein